MLIYLRLRFISEGRGRPGDDRCYNRNRPTRLHCSAVHNPLIQCSTVLCIAVGCSEVGCSAVKCSAGLPPKYTPLYTLGWPARIAIVVDRAGQYILLGRVLSQY